MNRKIKTLCLGLAKARLRQGLRILVVFLSPVCFGADPNLAGKSPLDELPPYIKQITYFGERPDWSHDGKRILFLSKMFGDAMEIEVNPQDKPGGLPTGKPASAGEVPAGGKIRMLTSHFYHAGFVRAMYLANGDILLSGARKFDPEHAMSSRLEKNAELWVLKKDLSGPPVPLGEHCSEGPAVSRTKMTIAWTLRDKGEIYMGDIVDENGIPKLVNKKLILDATKPPLRKGIETQNFRPPDEKELIFSGYSINGGDVMGLDIATGKYVDYSNSPKIYDEPEGIFPDGKYTLVECDRHNPKGTGYIDIYKLTLDPVESKGFPGLSPGNLKEISQGGSGQMERLTYFADYPGYKAANPVVSDDGKYIAFQYAKRGDLAGVGRGILVFDIAAFEAAKAKQ